MIWLNKIILVLHCTQFSKGSLTENQIKDALQKNPHVVIWAQSNAIIKKEQKLPKHLTIDFVVLSLPTFIYTLIIFIFIVATWNQSKRIYETFFLFLPLSQIHKRRVQWPHHHHLLTSFMWPLIITAIKFLYKRENY